jgi:hypothetical protein
MHSSRFRLRVNFVSDGFLCGNIRIGIDALQPKLYAMNRLPNGFLVPRFQYLYPFSSHLTQTAGDRYTKLSVRTQGR